MIEKWVDEIMKENEKWIISPRGRKLVELVRKVQPTIEKELRKDTYLRIMMAHSRSFVE